MAYAEAKAKAKATLDASSKVHAMGSDHYEAARVLRENAHNTLMTAARAEGFGEDFNPYYTLYS